MADPTSPDATPLTHATSVADLREDYRSATFDIVDADPDPFRQFDRWFGEALAHRERDEPSAMTLATSDANAIPSARTVLLKGFDANGFTWFTNYESQKGRELTVNPVASLCFRWAVFERQVIISGPVTRVSDEESDAYFNSRPKGSRIGAIVSAQSSIIEDRSEMEQEAARLEAGPEDAILRPYKWGGFRLAPLSIEFWQGRSSRLHDRIRYRRYSIDEAKWSTERLSP
jgi:pyridoxamine 5'-phosphate oxidase